jgi:hypothetical protein
VVHHQNRSRKNRKTIGNNPQDPQITPDLVESFKKGSVFTRKMEMEMHPSREEHKNQVS